MEAEQEGEDKGKGCGNLWRRKRVEKFMRNRLWDKEEEKKNRRNN
jgi:hypothetical protein